MFPGRFTCKHRSNLQTGGICRIWKTCRIEGICRIWKICTHWIIRTAHCFQVDSQSITETSYNQFRAGLHTHLLIFRGLGRPFLEHFGVLGDHFGFNLVIMWCKGAFRKALECPKMDFWWFLMISGCPIGTLLAYFFIFYAIWGVKKHVWIAGTILDDSWLEKLMISGVPTFQKQSKNNCFR